MRHVAGPMRGLPPTADCRMARMSCSRDARAQAPVCRIGEPSESFRRIRVCHSDGLIDNELLFPGHTKLCQCGLTGSVFEHRGHAGTDRRDSGEEPALHPRHRGSGRLCESVFVRCGLQAVCRRVAVGLSRASGLGVCRLSRAAAGRGPGSGIPCWFPPDGARRGPDTPGRPTTPWPLPPRGIGK